MKPGMIFTIALTCLAGCGEVQSLTPPNAQDSASTTSADNRPTAGPNDPASIADVLEANSKVMDEIGKMAETITETTDIIMRFNHFTDGHTERVVLCPECYPPPDESLNTEVEDPEEAVPQTLDQLLRDANEMHMSAMRFRNHLNMQKGTLERHLEKLRAGSLDEAPAADTPAESQE